MEPKAEHLCDLWEEIIAYRKALVDRAKAWRYDERGTLDVFGDLNKAMEYYHIPERPKYRELAERDLVRFDECLLEANVKDSLGDFLKGWLGYNRDFSKERRVDRSEILQHVDTLELAVLDKDEVDFRAFMNPDKI